MISPTPGRVVWFRADGHAPWIPHEKGQPNAALVVGVHSDTCVNLVVFGFDGSSHARENVELIQADASLCQPGQCTWMPYQRGQAAKTDELSGLAKEEQLKLIRERGLVERADGKGFDLAPAKQAEKLNPTEPPEQAPPLQPAQDAGGNEQTAGSEPAQV